MIMLAQSDVLKGLKRFVRLTELDTLLSKYADDPLYWTTQAAARRNVYRWLIEIIGKYGVDQGYLFARKRYDDLPHFSANPAIQGQKDALQMFFVMVGKIGWKIAGEVPVNAQVNG